MILRLNQTARTMTFLVTSHQTLLGKVGNVGCQNRMDSMHEAISANHGLSLMTSIDQQVQEQGHCVVE